MVRGRGWGPARIISRAVGLEVRLRSPGARPTGLTAHNGASLKPNLSAQAHTSCKRTRYPSALKPQASSRVNPRKPSYSSWQRTYKSKPIQKAPLSFNPLTVTSNSSKNWQHHNSHPTTRSPNQIQSSSLSLKDTSLPTRKVTTV